MKKSILIFVFALLTVSLPAPGFNCLYIAKAEPVNIILSWSNIDLYISKIDIKEQEIVKAQIRHETGNLTSEFCQKQNNLFGMRFAPLRKTTAIGEGNHMAKYRSWQESLLDYKIWQDMYYHGGDYFKFLVKIGYATDPWYIYKLRKLTK